MNCKNCNHILSNNFCSNCGQKVIINRITIKETLTDFSNTVFSLESTLFTTLKGLFSNPGAVFRGYLKGKRKTYYKPVSFFILTTIIYLICRGVMNYDALSSFKDEEVINNKLLISSAKYMAINLNHILLILVFSCGLSLKLFFPKTYYFAEYISISFYLVGVFTIFSTLGVFGSIYISPNVKFLFMLLFMIYMIWSCKLFFIKSTLMTYVKLIATSIFSIFLFMMLGYGFSILITLLKTS